MKNVNLGIIYFGVICIIIVSGFGAWKLERWMNWKLGYSEMVSKEVQPLTIKVNDLEKRISQLESNWCKISLPERR